MIDDPKKRPLAIDLICGAGGLSLGFESAGFDIVLASDIDPVHCFTHEFNFPYSKIICEDSNQLSKKRIFEEITSTKILTPNYHLQYEPPCPNLAKSTEG